MPDRKLRLVRGAPNSKVPAAAGGLLELPRVLERLRQTNARFNPQLLRAALECDQAWSQPPPGRSH